MLDMSDNFNDIKNYLYDKWKKSTRYKDYIVELSDNDVELAKRIANERYSNHRKTGKKNKSYGLPEDGREILGCLGELAMIRWAQKEGYKVSIKQFLNTSSELKFDDDFDTDIVFNGETFSVEVKTTEKPMKSNLIIPKHQAENKTADVYVLICKIDNNRYCIKGFTNSQEVLNNYNDTLKRPGYSVPENLLKNSLNDIINKEKK